MTDSRPAGGGANEDRVGARIFQTWKSKVTLPDNFAYWRSTLIDKNPSFSFTLWDDTDNRNFIAGHFPWFLAIYDRFPAEIYRADCVRYFHLYMYGGFYIDLDTECLQPLQKFVESQDVLLCRMGPYPDFSHAVPNAIMASRPREEFWLLVIAIIRASYGFGLRGAEALTGPVALKTAVDIYLSKEPLLAMQYIRSLAMQMPEALKPRTGRSRITLLPQKEWYPLDWSDAVHQEVIKPVQKGQLLSDEKKRELFPESSLVTYWVHSWAERPPGA